MWVNANFVWINQKYIVDFFFSIPTKKFCIIRKKKWNCKLKIQKYCRIKVKILLIQIKLKKFCWNFAKVLTISFSLHNKTIFFTSIKKFAYSNQNVLNKTRYVVLINFFLRMYISVLLDPHTVAMYRPNIQDYPKIILYFFFYLT